VAKKNKQYFNFLIILLAVVSSSFFVLKQRKKQRKFKKNAIASGSFFWPAPLQSVSVWCFIF
jgi:hypothetical protein